MALASEAQIPGVYRRRIGDIVVTALSDGFLDGSLEVLQNITPDEAAAMLRAAFKPVPRRTSVNCFVIESAGRVALLETGSGTYLAPTAGALRHNMAAAGFDPASVQTILLTHMHPDHSAGLTNRDTGERYFPNAELRAHEEEFRYWFNDASMANATERERALYFGCTREQVSPYRDRYNPFTGGEVFPGVTAVPLPGHTPGHTGYLVQSENEQLLIWGDIVHVPDVQVPRPEVTIAFDTDPAAAAATRRRIFDQVAADRLLVAGMHIHFPGFANLTRQGDGYAIIYENWQQAL